MVRTGDGCVRATGGKSSSKKGSSQRPSSSGSSTTPKSSSSSSSSSSGGNPVCPRETPAWQKPITNFFEKKEVKKEQLRSDLVGCSGISVDRNKKSVMIDDDITDATLIVNTTSDESEVQSDPVTPVKKMKLDSDGKENISTPTESSVSITPTSEKKRKSNHINILTPKRKKQL